MTLLEHEVYSPAKTVRLMEEHPTSVSTLWPLLTESVRVAQQQDKLPHWRDEKKRAAESEQIAAYLNDLGYTAEELGGLVDHRALLVARDAAKWRAQQRAKSKQAPTATGKVVKPGAARADNPTNSRYVDALAKARKTGRPEDIERALRLKGT